MRRIWFVACVVGLTLSGCAFPLMRTEVGRGPLPSAVDELRQQLTTDATTFVVVAQGEFQGGTWAYGGYLPSDPERAGNVCDYAITVRVDPDGSGSSGGGGGSCAPVDSFASRASVGFIGEGPVTAIVGANVQRVQVVIDGGDPQEMTVVHPEGFPTGFAWIDLHAASVSAVTDVTAWDAAGDLVCAEDDPDVDPCGDFAE